MAEDFLKLHRKMLKWGWYDDVNTCRVFIHCLLKANWKAGEWHGINYSAGQFITSLETLSVETHLSVQQVRSALQHLIATGELTSNQQGKARIITVNNWNDYQADNKVDNKIVTGCQQDDNKVVTTDKDIKKERYKEVKNIYGEYKHVRLTQKQYDKLVTDYGEESLIAAIKYLDEYLQMNGKKYTDHNLVLRKWVFDAVKRDNGSKPQENKKIHNFKEREYDFDELMKSVT